MKTPNPEELSQLPENVLFLRLNAIWDRIEHIDRIMVNNDRLRDLLDDKDALMDEIIRRRNDT